MRWRHGFAVGLIALFTGCGGEPKPAPPGAKEVGDPSLEVEQGSKTSTPGKSESKPPQDTEKVDGGEAKPSDAVPPDPLGDTPQDKNAK